MSPGEVYDFESGTPRKPEEVDAPLDGRSLVVDVDGFEGPLDLLLTLARSQKVDLSKISILELAEQYLAFVEEAKRLELELAADYLVMASWLAFLKSRLLLPPPEEDEEPSAEEMAARLAFRLQRLEAMRDSASKLMARDRMGRDIFARGMPEGVRVIKKSQYSAEIYDLLKAYSTQRAVQKIDRLKMARRPVLTIEDARKRLENMLGTIIDWDRIDVLVPPEFADSKTRRSGIASTFSASLEFAKHGRIELRQAAPFAPLYVRRLGDGTPKGPRTPEPVDAANGNAS
ncbi:MAG: segregation and condensation protein A [Candidatus Phaeomarinobacter sp.]